METVNWKVEGMSCSNCALTISQYLEKEGMKDVKVNLIGGDVSFAPHEGGTSTQEVAKGISSLGYTVITGEKNTTAVPKKWLHNHFRRFIFCGIFTLPLLAHMLPVHIHWLMNPWVQLTLCIPVYVVGMSFFGRSAIKSIRNGMPNMNVLIALGATAAFVYSLTGTLMKWGEEYMFYETTATIITLVFLGNYLEERSIQTTQRALNALAKSQKVMANMIAFDDQHQEHIFPVENTQLRVGDLILIKSGEQVPIDCKILWGDARVNEAIITGESLPVEKHMKDALIGGSVLENGTVKAQVTAVGADTVLSGILQMVQQAQGEKPPVQKMADRISAIFVPIVLGITLLTFVINYFIADISFTQSLMRSIAVLVIACPCAMGLATPAAIAVGLGRAARNGVLFRNATSLETFKDITQVVFDKTGTLTTGQFAINDWKLLTDSMTKEDFVQIAYSLEKYSNHPIARCIAQEWKTKKDIRWKSIEEVKGNGMKAIAQNGDEYWSGSYKIANTLTREADHNVYITCNNQLLGWIDVKDEIRPEAATVISYLKQKGIKTILLSGDRVGNCIRLADKLGIETFFAEQTPEQKLAKIAELSAAAPTAMVGDGINDAPALAKATIGISLGDASSIAVQSAQVVLMNKGLKNLPLALGLGKHTYLTIKQNLFWAFFYNIIAIPVAAFGFLSPTFGALIMGLSDVVLAINSVRLFVKKVE
jgi:P-type Cu+ transporter